MSKNKTVLAVILLLALIPLTANATITRVIGLGGEGANYIIHDAANAAIWPQLVQDYPKLAGGEFFYVAVPSLNYDPWDSTAYYSESTPLEPLFKTYINYSFEDGSVLQFSLDKILGTNSALDPSIKYTQAPEFLSCVGSSRFSAIYARKFGDFKAGLQVGYAAKSLENKVEGGTDETSFSAYGAKVGLTGLENKLDAALGFETAGFTEKTGGVTEVDNDGSGIFNFAARYWYDYSDRAAFVPTLRYVSFKDARTIPHGSDSYKSSDFVISGGHNWTPAENMLAVFEFGLMFHSTTHDTAAGEYSSSDKHKENSVPYWRLGFESKISSWLDGRFGAERHWAHDVTQDSKHVEDFTRTDTYLGVTWHVKRFYFDLMVSNPTMATTSAPQFVSSDPRNNRYAQISFKYDFNQ